MERKSSGEDAAIVQRYIYGKLSEDEKVEKPAHDWLFFSLS